MARRKKNSYDDQYQGRNIVSVREYDNNSSGKRNIVSVDDYNSDSNNRLKAESANRRAFLDELFKSTARRKFKTAMDSAMYHRQRGENASEALSRNMPNIPTVKETQTVANSPYAQQKKQEQLTGTKSMMASQEEALMRMINNRAVKQAEIMANKDTYQGYQKWAQENNNSVSRANNKAEKLARIETMLDKNAGSKKKVSDQLSPGSYNQYLDQMNTWIQEGRFDNDKNTRAWSDNKLQQEIEKTQQEIANKKSLTNADLEENRKERNQIKLDKGKYTYLDVNGLDVGMAGVTSPGEYRQTMVHEKPEDYENYQNDYDRLMYDAIHGDGAYDQRVDELESDEDVDALDNEIADLWDRLSRQELYKIPEEDEALNAREEELYKYADNNTSKEEKYLQGIEQIQTGRQRMAEFEANAPTGEYEKPQREYSYNGNNPVRTLIDRLGGGTQIKDKADETYWKIREQRSKWNQMSTQEQMDLLNKIGFKDVLPSGLADSFYNTARAQEQYYAFMTPEMQNTFEKYYESGDKESAMAYLEAIKQSGYLEMSAAKYKELIAYENSQGPYGALYGLLTVPEQMQAGIINLGVAAANAVGLANTSEYDPILQSQRNINATRQGRSEVYGETAAKALGEWSREPAKFLTNVAYSMLDNMAATGVGKVVGGGNVDRTIKAVQLMMSGSATSNKFVQKLDEGRDPGEAALYAIGDGIIEWVTEKYSLDELLRPDMKEMLGNKKQLASFLAKQNIVEGSEEVASDLLNMGLDAMLSVVYDHENEITARVNELVDSGMDPNEALKQAWTEKAEEIGQSALAGAISGFGMGVGRVAVNSIGNYQTGGNVNANRNAQRLVDVAKGMDGSTMSRQLASQLDEQIKKGNKPTNVQLGKLAQLMVNETGEAQGNVIKETIERNVRDELTQQGVKNAEQAAQIISKNLLEGTELTKEEQSILAQDKNAIETWRQYNTTSAESMGLQMDIAKNTQEQRSLIDTVSELTSSRAQSSGVLAGEVERSVKETKNAAEAIDNLQSRLPNVLSEGYAKIAKDILETDQSAKKNTNYLDDVMKIRMAAMTLDKNVPTTRLNTEAAQKLFDAARDEFIEMDKNRVVNQAKIVPGKGRVTFDGAEYGTQEWQQKLSGLTKMQRNQMGALGEIVTRMGNTLNLINDTANPGIYGFEQSNGAITINIAGMNRSGIGHHMLVTMSHEMTHWLEQNSAEGYAQLRQYIVDNLRSKGENVERLIIDTINNQNAVLGAESGNTLDLHGAMAEVVAKSCENLLSSENLRNEIAKTNPSLYNKIKTFVKDFAARVRQAVKGMTGSLSREARTLLNETEKIADLWTRARQEALNRESGTGTQAAEEGISYALDQYTQHQIDNWEGGKIVVYTGTKSVADFVNNAVNNPTQNKKMYFGTIGPVLAELILNKTGIETEGLNVALGSYEVRKIIKNHGNAISEAKRGQIGITAKEIEESVQIISEPDDIQYTGQYENHPAITFYKNINGFATELTYVVDDAHDLRIETLYKNKNNRSLALPSYANNAQLPSTSKTTQGTAPTTNLPYSNIKVKLSVAQMNSQYNQAVRDGDTERQQQLVYEAGRKAGYTIKAYHGTARADRVGTVFRADRATSGPFAYFTDNRDIAQNYARDKQDTSIAYEEEYQDYHTQFRVKVHGKDVQVGKLWNALSFAERQKITERARHITLDDDAENIIYDENNQYGIGNFTDYERKLHGWNSIETLIDGWLDGGTLFGREEDFLQVLKLAGIEGVKYNNPDMRVEKVYDTLLKIDNPFDVYNMYNEQFLNDLENWWSKQNRTLYEREGNNADTWDKNNISMEDWIRYGRDEVKENRTGNWTRIPDGVSAYLKEKGYDGIKDHGGKGNGIGHTVWIPFTSEQVKSADPITYDENGDVIPLSERFNETKEDIRWSVEQSPDMEVDRFMLGLNEQHMNTLQEKTMLRQYKDLKGTVDITRHKIREREAELRKLEQKRQAEGKLSAYDREQVRKLNNLLTNDRNKLERVQAELVKVTGEKGYARLMMKQDSLMRNLVNGVTADKMISLIEEMGKQLDEVNTSMKQRAEALDKLAQKEAVLRIRQQFNQTGLKRIAARLKSEMGSDLQNKEIENRLALIALKMKEGKYDAETAEELTDMILGKMRGGYDSYVLSTLRGETFALSPAQQRELKARNISLRDLNAELAGTGIRFAAKGNTNLEHKWQDLCDEITSMERNTDPLEQVDELMRVIRSERNTVFEQRFNNENVQQTTEMVLNAAAELLPEITTDEKSMKLISETLKFVGEVSAQAAQTSGEISDMTKVIDRIKETGAKARSGANKLTGNIQDALSYFNELAEQSEAALWRKERVQLIEQLKSKNTEDLLKEQEKWKERIAKDKAAREKMESNQQLRRKITSNVSRIRKLLINETDVKNIPEHMKSLAREMLGMIVDNDLIGRKISGIMKADLVETKRVLDIMKQQDGDFTLDDLRMIDDEEAQAMVEDALAELEDGIGFYNNRASGDMISNLQAFHNALDRISNAVSTITSVINAERQLSFWDRRMDVADGAEMIRRDMGKSRFKGDLTGRGSKAINTAKSAVFYGNMTPVYFFKTLRNSGLDMVWQDMQRGENRSGLETQKAKAYLQALAERTNYRSWQDEKHEVTLGGKKMTISVENMMELYAIWKREQTTNPEMSQHLSKGGVYFREEEDTGKLRREQKEQRAVRVTDEEIGAMYDGMTDDQKAYIEGIVSYLSNDMSRLGNEASMRMYGIEKYKESYYFPMKVWDGVKSARSDRGITGTDENRAAHRSWSKRRMHMAQNALVIGNFTQDAVNHIVEMINYNTMAPSIENMNKILNFQFEEGQTQDDATKRNLRIMFQEAYGKEALRYLETFMKDLNGGVTQDQRRTLRDRALTMFKKNAVAGSMSVVLQQPLSFIRAAMLINPKYLAPAPVTSNWKQSYTEMMAHSGVGVIKDMGRFDMNFGQSAKDYITPETKKSVWTQFSDLLTIAPQMADRMTWTWMWAAVKAEQKAQHPDMDVKSDAFLDMVGERFNQLMRETQVYDSVLVKSSNMRSQNAFAKLITSFMAEPTLTLNVLADAVGDVKAGQKGAAGKLAKAAATFFLSAIMQAAVKGLMGSGRTPDKQKTWTENFLNKFVYNLINEGNIAGLIPGYSDLIEVLKTGKLTDDAMGAIGKLFTVVQTIQNRAEGKGNGWWRDLEDTAAQLAQLFTNIPAKNLMRDGRAIYNWIVGDEYADRATSAAVIKYQSADNLANSDTLLGTLNTWLGGAGFKTGTNDYAKRIYAAKKAGNDNAVKEMTEYYVLAKSKAENPQDTLNKTLASLAKADNSLSAEEKIDLVQESSTDKGAESYVIDQLKKGKITAAQARKDLKEIWPDKSDDDIWWQVDRAEYKVKTGKENVTGNYYRLVDAVNNNKSDEIRSAVDDLLKHGITKEKIKNKLSDWKSEYLAADSAGKVKIKDALQKAYKAAGYTAADANKTIEGWMKEKKKKK